MKIAIRAIYCLVAVWLTIALPNYRTIFAPSKPTPPPPSSNCSNPSGIFVCEAYSVWKIDYQCIDYGFDGIEISATCHMKAFIQPDCANKCGDKVVVVQALDYFNKSERPNVDPLQGCQDHIAGLMLNTEFKVNPGEIVKKCQEELKKQLEKEPDVIQCGDNR